MPKRFSRGARERMRAMRPVALEVSLPVARSLDAAAFGVGDVVIERQAPHRLGRVCEVEESGSFYRVFFVGESQCLATAGVRLAPAQAGTDAPVCTADC
jgi:hypothetical protein